MVLGTDGVQKMSKSLGNVIDIFADPRSSGSRSCPWSPTPSASSAPDPGRPEVCNVCQLHRFFGDDYEAIWEGERTARTGCVDTKRLLADRMLERFAEARERRAELEARPGYVEEVLRAGAERLAPLARRDPARVPRPHGARPDPLTLPGPSR